jgi:hypothetical protein
VDSIDAMDNIAEPSAIVGTMSSMTNAIGTMLAGIMKTSSIEASEDSSAAELCGTLVPVDKASADKPGVVEYDADIGDNIDMQIPSGLCSSYLQGTS